MKRGTIDHPKTRHLCTLLNIIRPTAVGILECLWHWTAMYAPQGDIGKHSDDAIEEACFWPSTKRGKGKLLAALIAAGWVDKDPGHRLIVHDWDEHADEAVKKRLTRAGIDFVTGKDPFTHNGKKANKGEAKSGAEAKKGEKKGEMTLHSFHAVGHSDVETNPNSVETVSRLPEPEPEPDSGGGPIGRVEYQADFTDHAAASPPKSSFPKSLALIRSRWPTTDEGLLHGIAESSNCWDDSFLELGIREAHRQIGKRQVSQGLFLMTVPPIIEEFRRQGLVPQGDRPRLRRAEAIAVPRAHIGSPLAPG
jgi:hypothetical protein